MNSSGLLPLYLRREPTTDFVLKKYAPEARRFDVVAYRNRNAQNAIARWPWYHSGKPRRDCRTVMLDCLKWQAIWIK